MEKLGVFHMAEEPRRSGSSFELRIQSLCSYLLSCVAITHMKYRVLGPRVREGPQPSEGAVSGLCSSGPLDGAESGEASILNFQVDLESHQDKGGRGTSGTESGPYCWLHASAGQQ